MKSWAVPRLYRRAILVYLVAIVAPVAAFVWLGVQTLERQRTVIVAQANDAVARELESRITRAARAAFADLRHPIVRHTFTWEAGALVRPALRAPLPDRIPDDFQGAYRQESAGDVDVALQSFRSLLKRTDRPSLALHGVARCLEKLGRHVEAREAWRRLAREFPNARDLSHRPYGVTAAIAGADTAGLFDRIASARWELSRDQAVYFLDELDPRRTSPYLERFQFAEALAGTFHPPGSLVQGEIHSDVVGPYRVFYRREGSERVTGFSVSKAWIATTLKPQIERALDIAGTTRKDRRIYVGSIALVLLVLSAGVVLLLRDVSREAQTNRARAELVSSVSHELKTPITLVRLYSETLLRNPGFPDDERLGFYRIIARESTRLGRLIDQVLTFARVDRGAHLYHLEEGDLTTVVAGVVDDYREYLDHAGYRLIHALPESAPPVRFDGAAISQALLNLLDNAVKYSGQSKEIGVRMSVDGGEIAIDVEDHGIGIDPAEQGKVFERFYRVANGTGKGGYGLGLFLVRHIMEAHGGRAEVHSEPGRGSRFRLILPATAV
jgi:signal transduction histidine kinase